MDLCSDKAENWDFLKKCFGRSLEIATLLFSSLSNLVSKPTPQVPRDLLPTTLA